MINIEFKENAWKYNNLEKVEIVILGINGVIKNICSNFNIAESTFRRWRQKIYSTSEKIFKKDTSGKGNLKSLEGKALETASKAKLLSMIPSDILNSLKASDEYKSYCVEAVNSKDNISITDACKSIGISEKTYYKNKDSSLGDVRLKFPALTALDILLDNNGIDKDSLMLKMLAASIPVTRSDAGNFRWQAQIYIKKHKLKDIPKLYQFVETDNCWSMDFKNFYDKNDNVTYLLKIIDERSRMDIANIVTSNATTKAALELINKALESTGRKPFAIKTDRGTQFKVTFANGLKDLGIKHLKSYPNFPQFNAKIERRFKDLTLFEINNPNMSLEKMIILESNLHNYVKSHKSLGGLTPSDVYWKGLDPPFNQSNFTTEKISNWFPKVDTDLEIYITI